jgi:hypothetical protein
VQRSTATDDGGSIGKRTRAQALETGQPPTTGPARVHAAAEHGISGSATALPHAATIQALFGRHDISGIRAHTGPEAKAGAQAMGAEAFATGHDIAFAGTPSLHTAAHEAAHTVQQRGGVQLAGGVGAVGDAYENHADGVAEAVVSGRSAEGLLDAAPGGGIAGGGIQRVVQRDVNAKTGGNQQLDLNHDGGTVPAPSPGVTKDTVHDPFHHPYWPTFQARIESMFAAIAPPDGAEPVILARQLWSGVLSAMTTAQPSMNDQEIYKDNDLSRGWIAMDSSKFQEVMHGFDSAMENLRSYTSSQFATAKSFGFWSTAAGKSLAEATCDITLETSGVGALFDKLPSLDNAYPKGWDPQLWAALSNAYATAVGNELKRRGKKAHVCVGPNASPGNIFDLIESVAIKKQIEPLGRKLSDVTVFHAAATKPGLPHSWDPAIRRGQFDGTAWSGGDLQTAREQATKYHNGLGVTV